MQEEGKPARAGMTVIAHDAGEYVDTASGEVLSGVPVFFAAKTKLPAAFLMVFQQALTELAQDDRINWESARVLLLLMGRLSWENFIHIKQSELAEALQMRQSNVSRALRVLADAGYIEVGPRGSHSYRLSIAVGWKGKAKTYKKTSKKQQSPRKVIPLPVTSDGTD